VYNTISMHVTARLQHLVNNFFSLERVNAERMWANFIQKCSVEVLKHNKKSILVVFEDFYQLNNMIIRFELV